MKNFMFGIAIALLALTSGCMTTRRHVPTLSRGQLDSGYQQPYGYQPSYGPSYSQYGFQGSSFPAMFVSEYAGSTYDPRTAEAVVQAEMAREQARRSAQVATPAMQQRSSCVNCSGQQEALGAVMDEVDQLRQEVNRQ